jgi:hypothetical protein
LQAVIVLFKQIQQAGIPHIYQQANCHNIAHYVCLIAQAQGVSLAKIWAFSPSVYTATDPSSITFDDKFQLSPTGKIDWGYHVAPILFVQEGVVITAMAIDLVLFPEGPVPYQEWLEQLQTEKLIYLLMDKEWYSFNTLYPGNSEIDLIQINTDEIEAPNIILPEWFANTCVTDFFKYEDTSKEEGWLEMGLAINDTASIFYEKEIEPILNDPSKAALLNDYRILVGNVLNFETVFRNYMYNYEMDEFFYSKHLEIIERYRILFTEKCLKWKQKLADLETRL